MTLLSLSDSNLISDMLKNPDEDLRKVLGLIEEKIKQSKKRSQRIFDNSIEGICIVDTKANMTFVNQCMADIVGYTREELIGNSIYSLTSEEETGVIKKHLKNRKKGISEKYQANLKHNNGNEVYVQIKAAPLYDEGGKFDGSVAFIEDITEKLKIEQQLRESEEKFRTIAEQSLTAIGIFQNNKILYLNKAYEVFTGMSLPEIYSMTVNEIIDAFMIPEERKRVKTHAKITQSGKRKIPDITESQVITKDGNKKWVLAHTKSILYQGRPAAMHMIIDITKRRQAELQLKESEQRYRNVIKDQTELIVRWRANGILTFVNDSYCNYFQKTRAELVGASFLPLIPEEDHEITKRNFSLITKEHPIMSHEHRIVKPNAKIAWISWMNRAIFDEHGKIVEYQAVGRDITERKRIEQKLKESEEEYHSLFESSPIALMEQDLSEMKKYIDHLRTSGIKNFNKFFNHKPDELLKIMVKPKLIDVNAKTIEIYKAKSKKEFISRINQLSKNIDRSMSAEAFLYNKLQIESLICGEKKFESEVETITFTGERLYLYAETSIVPGFESTWSKVIVSIIDITERKKIEEFLKESETKFRKIIENAKEGYFEVDLKGNLTFFNKAFLKLLKYTQDELIGKNYVETTVENSRNRTFKAFNDVFKSKNEINNFNYTLVNKLGEIIYGISSVNLRYDSNGKIIGFSGFMRDITEKKKAEEELRREYDLNKNLIQSSPAYYVAINSEGKTILMNTAMLNILGYTLEEVIGQEYLPKFVPEREREQVSKTFRKLSDFHTSTVSKNHILTKSGQELLVEWVGRPVFKNNKEFDYFFGFGIDITERTKAEKKLELSEEKYKNLIETSSMGLVEIEIETKQLAYINPKLLEIIDYTYDDLIREKKFLNFIHPEDLKEIDFSSTDKNLEFRVLTKKGNIKWLSGDSHHFYDEKGKLKYVRLWLQDITEKKSLEEIKANLLMRFSHEFKTPLISIKGFSEFLLEEYRDKLSDKIISFLEKIHQGANKLKFLTNTFLETSQLDENIVRVKIREVNFANLISEVLAELEGIIKSRNHTINLKIDKNLLIECDSEKISTIMSNLILNSSKFTPPAGIITVSANKERDSVIITVTDNGIGLSIEEKKKIFLPFGKIERYGQGFDIVPDGIGMGLYISKELVELHKGTIWVESAGRNKGSTFIVKIPENQ